MAYDSTKPANDGYLAEFPPEMREQLRAMINDQIVDALKLVGLSPGNLNGNIPVSNGTLCNNLNAEKLGGNLASAFATTGHIHGAATTSSNGFMSNTDKAKLDGISTGAQVNQNAFGNVKVGTTTIIQADNVTDTLELVAGANIALTPDATNDRVTVAVTGTVASAAVCTGNASSATTAASCTGNAATATKLQNARTINGVSFDGSANITVTAAANGGTSAACSGNAATATKLQAARTISLTGSVTGSGSFDGSGNLSIATSGGVPVGAIFYFPAAVPPTGYLELNGALVSRTTYAALWAYAQSSGNLVATDAAWVAGQFSPGDGSTTFRIPDLRDEFIRGWDHGRGIDLDRSIGSIQNGCNEAHTHRFGTCAAMDGNWHTGHPVLGEGQLCNVYGGSGYSVKAGPFYNADASAGGIEKTGGVETRPRNVALLPCIKY
jgi:microcystin-dependent protein